MEKTANGRAMLDVAKDMLKSILKGEPILQRLTQKISEIMGVKRCVIFKLIEDDGACNVKIVSGVPAEEHELDPVEPIRCHPDIEEAVRRGEIMVISNPKESQFTAYFREIVEEKRVTEILYAPLISSSDGKAIGIIVVDAVERKGFSKKESQFCKEVAELISLIIDHEENITERVQHILRNRMTPLGGYALRLEKQARAMVDTAHIIAEEVLLAEKACPKRGEALG